MVDREKVVNGIQCRLELKCNECPYTSDDDVCDDCDGLFRDVLELLKEKEEEIENLKQTCQSMMEGAYLLKEQEAVEPSFKQGKDGIFVWCCGSCGAYLYHIYDGIDKAKEYAKFCRQCGKPVKWE